MKEIHEFTGYIGGDAFEKNASINIDKIKIDLIFEIVWRYIRRIKLTNVWRWNCIMQKTRLYYHTEDSNSL